MTIRINIKNEDNRENAIISVEQVYYTNAFKNYNPPQNLKGGESTEVYLHNDIKIIIKEVQNG